MHYAMTDIRQKVTPTTRYEIPSAFLNTAMSQRPKHVTSLATEKRVTNKQT